MLRPIYIWLTTALLLTPLTTATTATPPYTCGKARNTTNLTCGKTGSISHPQQIDHHQIYDYDADVLTLSECINLCRAIQPGGDPGGYNTASGPYCESFSFDCEDERGCQIYTESIKAQGFKSNKTATMAFYDAGCFECSECVATLTNGDFAYGDFDPWVTQKEPYFDTTGTVTGPNGLIKPGQGSSKYAFRGTAGRSFLKGGVLHSGTSSLVQRLDWCVGSSYNFSFWYKFDGPDYAYFLAHFDEGSYNVDTRGVELLPPLKKVMEWTFVSVVFEAAYEYAVLQFQLGNPNRTDGPAVFEVSNVGIDLV